MTGIGTVGEVIGGAPIDPHLLEGQEAAGGRGRSRSLIGLYFLRVTVGRVSTARLLGMCGNHG
jgi:hypothetical protein